jgi:hypothetical protein
MTFRPTKAMGLNDMCAYTAAYIFKPNYADLIGYVLLINAHGKYLYMTVNIYIYIFKPNE